MSADDVLTAGDRIGFIGLGNMGVPMVQRLLDGGFTVSGYDINEAQGTALDGAAGYHRAANLVGTVTGTRSLILMLPDSTVVEKVMLGAGLLDVMAQHAPESVLVDMSSSRPSETVRMAGEAAQRGVPFMDAPVSGGVPGAVSGSLTVMTGGPRELHERVLPALERIGSNVVHAGDAGAGHALKAINNLLSGSSLVASSEALLIGTRFGLDPEVMTQAINGSSGRSWSTMTKWPRYVIPRTFDSGFELALLLKDIRIATDLAEQVGVPAAHARLTESLYASAADTLPAHADHTDIYRWVEQTAAQED
ncbi:NAD(P)-dependent oxidoreductase [Ornithinimicrobium cavernae]|uniref:NAD(P)-dependent oxidoreductase n=1 Tax=Ornithinimicrobium cavernae TaxID=2666047 RepID=UPI000D69A1BF|nr:NAD(P)-dependent oxidoreductase [Ornithinimicrobium cavernae]